MRSPYIVPLWNTPSNVQALTTLKYEYLDFSLHNINRNNCIKKISRLANVPKNIYWLKQIHSVNVINLDEVVVDQSISSKDLIKNENNLNEKKIENCTQTSNCCNHNHKDKDISNNLMLKSLAYSQLPCELERARQIKFNKSTNDNSFITNSREFNNNVEIINSNDKDEGVVCNLNKNFIEADASFTTKKNIVCAVLTADCLPIFVTNTKGSMIAAIHAGWRGILNGIIENAICKFLISNEKCSNYTLYKKKKILCGANEIIVWMGPAIGPEKFEVGSDVKELFIRNAKDVETVCQSFVSNGNNKYLANIYMLARDRLLHLGILDKNIYCEGYCTYSETDKFYSYRKNQDTGRMVSMIWRK